MTKKLVQRVLVYRYKNENLEVFLEAPNKVKQKVDKHWKLPINTFESLKKEVDSSLASYADSYALQNEEEFILLDPTHNVEGDVEQTLAVEDEAKKNATYFFPDVKDGNFFELKEALKKVMPHQYKLLKELHEILSVRNIMRNL